MNRIVALGLALTLAAGAYAADKAAVKSGPQVGEELAGPFHPLNVNGKAAGKKHCLYCQNGANPVAMVFARQAGPELQTLVKKLDAACAKNADSKLASFVVICSDDDGAEAKAKKLAADADLKKVVVSIDNPAGPDGYKVSKDADVTVVLYVDRTVKANFAYKKGELTSKECDEVVKALPKITAAK